jgi:two-component system sensor histidine kinase KdpD
MSLRDDWPGYAWSAAIVAACTLSGVAMRLRFDLVNIAMVYLLGVVIVALRHSRGAAIFASLAAVASFDFFFVPPQGAFSVDDIQYLLTFAIMLAVALVISSLVGRIRKEAAQRAALAVEAETERIRSALLASISHDLRTPLAVLTGASSSLAQSGERMSADERRDLAQSVFDQSREISEHVAKVLQMTRLESQGIVLDRDWAAFSEITAGVLSKLEQRLAEHRVLVEVSDELPLVRVDVALVEQAVMNLLDNAAKHTPAGTAVRVLAEVQGRELVVTVQDYGGGLPEAELERVFEKFHRGAAEASGAGMGLGLSICRAIVRLHGGRAWAEGVPAGGIAFHFTLPLEEAPKMQLELSPAS